VGVVLMHPSYGNVRQTRRVVHNIVCYTDDLP
jgi:hypothetical protein